VPEEALYALTPGGAVGLVVTAALALAGAVRIARERRRVAILLIAWVAIPILFFTAVPAETRFFDRYVVAALPPFMLLTAAGCLTLTRRRLTVATALTVALLALEIGDDVERLRTLHDLDLRALPRPLDGQILFSSTGTPRSDRPPELLDVLVSLRWPEAQRLEELPAVDPRFDAEAYANGVRDTQRFVSQDVGHAIGIWLFRGSERRVRAATRRFAADPDVAVQRIGPELVVVTSRRPASRRALVELGVRIRETWGTTTPADRWPRTIARIDREALADA
jgi:hypothetical protein